jgi:hypothetical protein
MGWLACGESTTSYPRGLCRLAERANALRGLPGANALRGLPTLHSPPDAQDQVSLRWVGAAPRLTVPVAPPCLRQPARDNLRGVASPAADMPTHASTLRRGAGSCARAIANAGDIASSDSPCNGRGGRTVYRFRASANAISAIPRHAVNPGHQPILDVRKARPGQNLVRRWMIDS